MVESDARGRLQRENIVSPPENGNDLHLSVDAEVQSKLFQVLSEHAQETGFRRRSRRHHGRRDWRAYCADKLSRVRPSGFYGQDSKSVAAASNDASTPLLNRAISGLYAPGSIVKPIFAAAALNEGIISPDKIIVSTGAISIPNPYDPEHPSLFRDWAVHGTIDMRTALAVSSDEYFYTIGGGYGGQRGLGIDA